VASCDCPIRALTVVDVFTRECLAVHADSSLSGSKVRPSSTTWPSSAAQASQITVDNGTEFYSKAMDQWAWSTK
jgi:putative transposase